MAKPALASRIILVVAGALAAGALALYVQAHRPPRGYQPVRLDAAQRQEAAVRFYNHLADFHNHAVADAPFEAAISSAEINAYLASMDEIAAMLPGERPGQVMRGMAQAGLDTPAVILGDGRLTLMVRSSRHDKVISADLRVDQAPAGQFQVGLEGVHVGRLPIPPSLARGRLADLAEWLAELEDRPEDARTGPAALARRTSVLAMAALRSALEGRPLEPLIRVEGRAWRVRDVRISPQQIVMELQPE